MDDPLRPRRAPSPTRHGRGHRLGTGGGPGAYSLWQRALRTPKSARREVREDVYGGFRPLRARALGVVREPRSQGIVSISAVATQEIGAAPSSRLVVAQDTPSSSRSEAGTAGSVTAALDLPSSCDKNTVASAAYHRSVCADTVDTRGTSANSF